MLSIRLPSTMYGQVKTLMALTYIEIMCGFMCHRAVCCRCRMDGSHAARVRPLNARYELAFSHSLTARPTQLPLSGGYMVRPRRMQKVGITSICFSGKQVLNGWYTCK